MLSVLIMPVLLLESNQGEAFQIPVFPADGGRPLLALSLDQDHYDLSDSSAIFFPA